MLCLRILFAFVQMKKYHGMVSKKGWNLRQDSVWDMLKTVKTLLPIPLVFWGLYGNVMVKIQARYQYMNLFMPKYN